MKRILSVVTLVILGLAFLNHFLGTIDSWYQFQNRQMSVTLAEADGTIHHLDSREGTWEFYWVRGPYVFVVFSDNALTITGWTTDKLLINTWENKYYLPWYVHFEGELVSPEDPRVLEAAGDKPLMFTHCEQVEIDTLPYDGVADSSFTDCSFYRPEPTIQAMLALGIPEENIDQENLINSAGNGTLHFSSFVQGSSYKMLTQYFQGNDEYCMAFWRYGAEQMSFVCESSYLEVPSEFTSLEGENWRVELPHNWEQDWMVDSLDDEIHVESLSYQFIEGGLNLPGA